MHEQRVMKKADLVGSALLCKFSGGGVRHKVLYQ